MKPPPKLFALIVNNQFSALRVFGTYDRASRHCFKQIERWRVHDPGLANAWREAKIIPYRRAK